ncbi:MAG TPA: hypothetical protein VGY77_03645 [Gemmataceae bacterium]|jgi:triacylglycerol lipase|nr:hypothetical protein [Gemmataceae bacterium]
MTAQRVAETGASQPVPKPPLEIELRLEDTLAAGQRLWLRGGLLGSFPSSNGNGEARRWWKPWRKDNGTPPPPATLRLETRVSGSLWEAELPIHSDGRFEGTFTLSLPPARRGWRVARNCIRFADQTFQACNVVLVPPEDSAAAVLVILPFQATLDPKGVHQLVDSPTVPPLSQLVRNLEKTLAGRCPVYYLACVPQEKKNPQPELGLAVTALNWPRGHLVSLPTDSKEALATITKAVDRLRWLFAGIANLWLFNMEPELAPSLETLRGPQEDRASMHWFSDLAAEGRNANAHSLSDGAEIFSASLRPTRSFLVPRHPIVFCHGMLAFSMLKMYRPEKQNYFSPLREFLRQRGIGGLFPEVPATSGVVERAVKLKEHILRWTSDPVNMICHSMGGLDARYMITHLGMAEHVRSLTTISTPHRGSYMADWFVANYRQRVPLLLALEAFGFNVDGFRDCRLDICRAFNANTPDMPAVKYFSFGAEVTPSRLTPFLRRAWNLLTPIEGPNDGLVSLSSARWGEYLGTLSADHFAQTPDAVFLRTGEDFDSLGFFTRLVEDLARRGF